MKGRMFKFFEDKGYGFISGEDSESYFFHMSQLTNSSTITRGDLVEFEPTVTSKGKQAKRVKVINGGNQSKKFIAIGNIRIKLSNIKNYGLSYEYAVYDIKSEGGGISSWNDSFLEDLSDMIFYQLNPYSFEEPTKYYEFLYWNNSYLNSVSVYDHGDTYEKEVACEKVPYVWITTFQNENYKFHDESKVDLKNIRTKLEVYDIEKIISELDMYLN